MSLNNRPGKLDHGSALLMAESKIPQIRGDQSGQIDRTWKSVSDFTRFTERSAVGDRNAIEQVDPHGERHLLARDRIDRALKHRGKPRWLHALKAMGQ